MDKPDAYIATVKRSVQISGDIDTWEESIVCHELVTLKDIHEWVLERTGYGGNYAVQVTISFAEVKND